MKDTTLPPREELFAATLAKDRRYEGVFVLGVKTTGIFCRPTCGARKPRPENVEFFRRPKDALLAGYRPCLRCHPLRDSEVPPWLTPVLERVESRLTERFTDQDLRGMGLEPARVRRWFQAHHGMTFHAYCRARRLGAALGRMRHGEALTRSAFGAGFESLSGFRDAISRLTGTSAGRAAHLEVVTVNRIATPLGPMVAGAVEEGLCLLEFADRPMLETQLKILCQRRKAVVTPGDHPIFACVAAELAEYFEGSRRTFSIPLVTPGSPFQQMVWDGLLQIPFGETRAYEEQARAIGRPTAVRAVGRANGQNRIAILIPCHRVIGRDGRLTGYGGGLWRKERLLEIEGVAVRS